MERKLTAILASDVVGYSNLMAEDEEATLAQLKAHRAELFDPKIAEHNGRIIKLMGDGALVEFASVVDAVRCALAVQSARKGSQDPIRLRIGINLGDVIIDGDDIYGDGVNIAARLETLAEAGGICISSTVHESLGNRIDIEFGDAGVHKLKNISRPIHVFSWPPRSPSVSSRAELVPDELKRDKTISVSPFQNLSSDDELRYFCDGVTEDIITAFGTIQQLVIIADQHQAEENPARYVLSGKVRKSGNRIRVSAQLVDVSTGIQIWVDRFDRDASDLFDVQDDIARNIVIAVHTELGAGSYTNRWQWGTENFEAWKLMAKGFREFQKFSPESLSKAAAMFEQALAIDPDYLAPLMAGGYCYGHLAYVADGEAATKLIAKAQSAFDRAAIQAPEDVRRYAAKRALEIAKGNHSAAVAAARTALQMAPNDSYTAAALSFALTCADRPAEALTQMTKAAHDMSDLPGWFSIARVLCHFQLGDIDKALQLSRETVLNDRELHAGPALNAAMAAQLGLSDEASMMSEKMLALDPEFSARTFVRWQGLKNRAHNETLLDALKAAGLPE